MSFSALLSLIDDLVPDTGARLKPGAHERAIEAARVQYSSDRPRVVLFDVVAVAGKIQAVPLDWEQAWSELQGIEYPVGEFPPVFLPANACGVLSTPSGDAIGLLSAATAGDVLRLQYTIPHVITAAPDECTVPAGHLEAVACWAAALLADQLAAAYADNTDPTIAADRIDYGSPSRTWASRAKSYRERYAQLVGVIGMAPGERPTVKPACAESDLDLTASDGKPWYRGRRR